MPASDGDSAEVVRSTLGIPNLDDHRVETHAVDITTSSNAGTATVTYDEAFADGDVFPFVTGDEGGDWHVDSAGSSQATVAVTNAETASGTVTAFLLVVGPDAKQA